jgi:hypothetical protein
MYLFGNNEFMLNYRLSLLLLVGIGSLYPLHIPHEYKQMIDKFRGWHR